MSSATASKTDGSSGVTPRHVAIIMDGNGRWAKNRGKLRVSGHKAGVNSVRRAVNFAVSENMDALTLYAFSSENWSRPPLEVQALMELFFRTLDREVKDLHKRNVRLRFIGDISRFNPHLQERVRRAGELTQQNNGLTLNIAANYGGRWDIINSVRHIARQVEEGLLCPDQITEETLSAHLSMNDLPAVDLVIRSGGEHRISNFLLWQIAYAELYFTDVLWPDFDEQVFKGALDAFAQRERRYGGSAPDVT